MEDDEESFVIETAFEDDVEYGLVVVDGESDKIKNGFDIVGYETQNESMNDDDQFNAEFLIQQYAEIRMKKSSLSSQRRAVVVDVVEQAIQELLDQNKLTIVPGCVFSVRNERARMKIVSIDNKNETLVISFKNKRETWSFIKLVDGIRSNVLILAYDKTKEGL